MTKIDLKWMELSVYNKNSFLNNYSKHYHTGAKLQISAIAFRGS